MRGIDYLFKFCSLIPNTKFRLPECSRGKYLQCNTEIEFVFCIHTNPHSSYLSCDCENIHSFKSKKNGNEVVTNKCSHAQDMGRANLISEKKHQIRKKNPSNTLSSLIFHPALCTFFNNREELQRGRSGGFPANKIIRSHCINDIV